MTNYMKKTKKELVTMLKSLQAENENLKKNERGLSSVDIERNAIVESAGEYEKLKALYEVREEEIEHLKKRLEETDGRLEEVSNTASVEAETEKAEIDNLAAENNSLTQRMRELEEEFAGLGKKNELFLNENKGLLERIDVLEDANSLLRKEHDEVVVKNKALVDELNEVHMKNSKIRAEYEAVLEETRGVAEKFKQTDARLLEAEEVLNNQSETLAAMKRYYELFTCLMEDCTDKYVFLDASYDIRYINQNARDYLGVSDNGPLIGKSFFDFIREKDAPAVKKALSKALFKGEQEKIKTAAYIPSQKKALKLKVKISRIQCYQDPSVMLVLK